MIRLILVVLAWAALSAAVQAHRLDEYLQAARLTLASDRVALELDVTPGVAIADEIVRRLDRDRDAVISPDEARAYAQTVLSEIALTLDGQPVAATLDRVVVSPVADLRDGVGTIQLRASAPVQRVKAGRHALRFQNNHHPETAVYLVNALTPDDRSVTVAGQHRTPTQREATIEYDVRPGVTMQWLWLLVALACLHRPVASAFRLRR